MIGIYCITNPSGHIYIGSSNNIQRRWKQYKRLNCKQQPAIYNSFIKYGVENHQFDIHLECAEQDLLYFEQLYIDGLKPELNCSKVAKNNVMYGPANPRWKGGFDRKEYDKKRKKQKAEYDRNRRLMKKGIYECD
jgi:group I intron endonuclease